MIVAEYSVYINHLITINVKFESLSLTANSSIIQDEAFDSFAAGALDSLEGADTCIRYRNDITLLYYNN